MTILVAAKNDEKVIIASDRMVSYWQHTGTIGKQFMKRQLTFAMCGTVRTGQVVKHAYEMPAWNEDHTEDSYMFEVAQGIRKLMKDTAMLRTRDGLEYMECSFLVAGLSKIYQIGNDFCVTSDDEFIADGCGYEIAIGSFKTQSDKKDLRKRVERTIEIVSQNSLFCGNGIDVQEYALIEPTQDEDDE